MTEKTCKHIYDERPWGNYEVVCQGAGFQMKKLEVNPRSRFSLQKHLKRSEVWIIVSGTGKATVGERQFTVEKGTIIQIAIGEVHRLENIGDKPLIFTEVQFGDYLGEDDIVRIEDDYKRA